MTNGLLLAEGETLVLVNQMLCGFSVRVDVSLMEGHDGRAIIVNGDSGSLVFSVNDMQNYGQRVASGVWQKVLTGEQEFHRSA